MFFAWAALDCAGIVNPEVPFGQPPPNPQVIFRSSCFFVARVTELLFPRDQLGPRSELFFSLFFSAFCLCAAPSAAQVFPSSWHVFQAVDIPSEHPPNRVVAIAKAFILRFPGPAFPG